jgi:uncharacterized protein YecT (DUF1311 family)
MIEMKSWFIVAALIAIAATQTGAAGKEKEHDFLLVTAPSGDFQLTRKSNGSIWVVPTKQPSDHVVLPPVQIEVNEEGSTGVPQISSDKVERQPRCFVSPDERWIFVEIDTGQNNTTGILYQRAEKPSESNGIPHYQPAMPKGFDQAAWAFLCQEQKLRESDIGISDQNGIWRKSLYFGAWSADSARLLVGLNGTVGQPKEPEGGGGPSQYESSAWMLCYFNTQTDAFELTDRLRKANSAQSDSNSDQTDAHAAEPEAVLSAESAGQESPEPSATDRFKKADAELNAIYKKLLDSLSSTEKTKLQNEERAWLTERDIFAAIHSYQSWSPFPNASRIEGMAIATEKRAAELQKRLSTGTSS